MKRVIIPACTVFITIMATVIFAGESGPTTDIVSHPRCKYCDMSRQQYAHSRTLVIYEDGASSGSCSLHCLAVDLALNIDKSLESIKVADYYTKDLVDAETAFWVIGGHKPGVMTGRAKWAFTQKKDAERFVHEQGGHLATFDEVLRASYEDMLTDLKMIRAKRKLRKMH